ncbi:hypothetical protein AVEN_148517-1 [Araneus ventricosus]|uniref:Uncharacterized protein n=1 Tax=Araneus ventricosus TaxID=182803 RepID=A0A4Y2KQA2_ARAVE|nr:hypothetical protein AVEN_148517-1 [Araneus ventricosus]
MEIPKAKGFEKRPKFHNLALKRPIWQPWFHLVVYCSRQLDALTSLAMAAPSTGTQLVVHNLDPKIGHQYQISSESDQGEEILFQNAKPILFKMLRS